MMPMSWRMMIVMTGACLSLAACSWIRPRAYPLQLCLHGSPRLQWYEERPHTLYVRTFPLAVVDGFAAADAGELLADPPPMIMGAVAPPQSRVLYPGTTETVTFGEVEGQTVSHLGIAAGYYDPKGHAKYVVPAREVRRRAWPFGGSCSMVEFGPSGIEGTSSAR